MFIERRLVKGNIAHEHKAIRGLSLEELKALARSAMRQEAIEGEVKELPGGSQEPVKKGGGLNRV